MSGRRDRDPPAPLQSRKEIDVADETRTETGESPGSLVALELGPSVNSAQALARVMTDHWMEATRAFIKGDLERFIRERLGNAELADFARDQAQGNGSSADARMFRLILRLDPKIEARYMGYELNEAGLAGLAAEQDGPFPTQDSSGALRTMYTDRVLTTYAEASGADRFRELDDRWHEEFSTWQELVERVKTSGGDDLFSALSWRARARILLGLVDTKAAEGIRERARAAASDKVTNHSWMKGLSPDDPSIGTVLATADLAQAAATTDDPVVVQRKARAKAIRGRIWSIVSTLVFIGLVVWGFLALSNTGGTTQAESATPTGTAVNPTAASTDPATASVQGTGVTNKAVDMLTEPKEGADVVQHLDQFTVVELIGSAPGFSWIRIKDTPDVAGYVPGADVSIRCPGTCNIAPASPPASGSPAASPSG